MRKFFKMIPAALAVVSIASCSNDDFFSENKSADNAGLASNVTVETPIVDGEASTRAGYAQGSDYSKTYFVKDDALRIYDETLSKYDLYKYDGTSKFASATNRVTPAFGLFPGDMVTYAAWYDNGTTAGAVKTVVTIPSKIVYNSKSEWTDATDGKQIYDSYLPLWGTAQADATYGAKTNLKFLTGGITITLDNAQGNAKYVVLKANSPLSGAFEATLEDNAVLKSDGTEISGSRKNYILVDLTAVPDGNRSTITLPVIVGKYTNLGVYYTNNAQGTTSDDAFVAGSGWTKIYAFEDDFTTAGQKENFTRGRINTSKCQKVFKLDATSPQMLSTVLAKKKNMTGTLNIDLTGNFTVPAEGQESDYTVYVPKMGADKININFDASGIAFATGVTKKLIFQDANDEKFDGEIIIKTPSLAAPGIEFNLTDAKVTLAGGTTAFATNINVTKVKEFTLDAATNGATIALTSIAEKFTIGENASIADNINVSQALAATYTGTAAERIAKAQANAIPVEVKGVVSGTATVNVGYCATTISGIGSIPTLETLGDVTVNRTAASANSSVAVSTLSMNNGGQTLDLQCGTISTLTTSITSTTAKKTLTLTNEETGPSAIGTITGITTLKSGESAPANYAMLLSVSTSKWAGLTTTTYSDNIYTASQLASITGAEGTWSTTNSYKLWNNMNMNNQYYVGRDLQRNFDGQNYTISNLKLTEKAVTTAFTGSNQIGLFAQVSGANDLFIKDFTLSGVSFDQPADVAAAPSATPAIAGRTYSNRNIGAVVGEDAATGKVNYSGITIANATFASTNHKNIFNVGGIVGIISGAAEKMFSGNNVTASITGYYALGGIVGEVNSGSNVKFEKNTVAPTFAVNVQLANNKSSDTNFGKVGDLVGTITSGTVKINQTALETNTITSGVAGNKVALHFTDHKVYYVSGGNTEEQFFFGCQVDNNWVGFSATGATLNVYKNYPVDDANAYNCYQGPNNDSKIPSAATLAGKTPWNYFTLTKTDVQ